MNQSKAKQTRRIERLQKIETTAKNALGWLFFGTMMLLGVLAFGEAFISLLAAL